MTGSLTQCSERGTIEHHEQDVGFKLNCEYNEARVGTRRGDQDVTRLTGTGRREEGRES